MVDHKGHRMQSILITGAAGFLGNNLGRYFHGRGWQVVGLDVADPGQEHWRSRGFQAWRVGPVSGSALSEVHDQYGPFAVVFHAAGNGAVGPSFADPLGDFKTTVAATAEILEVLRLSSPDTLFMFPSSAAVYGDCPNRPLAESLAPNPVSPYGWHKLMAEQVCRSYATNFGVRSACIRFFSLYGPGLRKQLLWDIYQKTLDNLESIKLFGTGDETRDMLYISDALELVFTLSSADIDGALVVNGGTGTPSSIRLIAEALAKNIGYLRRPGF